MTRYYFEHRLNIVKIMCLDIQLIHQKKTNIVVWDWVIVKIIQQNKANTGLIKLRHFNRWSIRNNMRNQFGIQPNRLHLFHIFGYSHIELALRLFCTAFSFNMVSTAFIHHASKVNSIERHHTNVFHYFQYKNTLFFSTSWIISLVLRMLALRHISSAS